MAKRTTYLLKDSRGWTKATVYATDDNLPEVEPWMLHNVQTQGWYLEQWNTQSSGVEAHGIADWQTVADDLSVVVTQLLADNMVWSEEEADALLERAQAALDRYNVTHMEVQVATVSEDIDQAEDGEPNDQG